jgi:beta-1,4-N-acetylglucosaminyltransferase
MLVAGEGGHSEQQRRLANLLSPHADLILVTESDVKSDFCTVKFSRTISSLSKHRNFIKRILAIIFVFISIIPALVMIYNVKPVGIIIHGPMFCAPFMIAGYILRKKMIFIESWSRFETESLTGRFAKIFGFKILYQNISLSDRYPKGVYVGRL